MDTVLQAFLSWQFILFGLACYAITWVFRKVIEYVLENPKVPTSKNSKIWTELVLPILPVIVGPLGALLASSYPYPEELKGADGRVIFGLVAGLLSGLMYRIVKSFLNSKFGISSDEESAAVAKVQNTINKE